MKQFSLLSLFIALSILCSCKSQDDFALRLERVDSLCTASFAPDEPGLAIAIMKDGKVVFDKGYGLADLETKTPIDGNTSFNICSMSKQFTAVSILQLQEKGLLSIDDNVHKYFPDFKADFWDQVTLANLMSHTSGVPDARDGYTREEKIFATDSLSITYMYDLDSLMFPVGEGYSYTNPTYVLLGYIVGMINGTDFEDYVHDNVFVPSGMDKSFYYMAGKEDRIPNMSHAYVMEDGQWKECDYGEETFFATRPDGGLYTSTHEFIKWEQALKSGKILKPETLALAQSPKHITDESPRTDYCYGWITEQSEGVTEPSADVLPRVIYHNGSNGGYRTIGRYYPQQNVFIVAFANRSDFHWFKFADKLDDILGL